jgi:hypothetical protein
MKGVIKKQGGIDKNELIIISCSNPVEFDQVMESMEEILHLKKESKVKVSPVSAGKRNWTETEESDDSDLDGDELAEGVEVRPKSCAFFLTHQIPGLQKSVKRQKKENYEKWKAKMLPETSAQEPPTKKLTTSKKQSMLQFKKISPPQIDPQIELQQEGTSDPLMCTNQNNSSIHLEGIPGENLGASLQSNDLNSIA